MKIDAIIVTDLVERSHSDGHLDAVLAVHVRGFGPHGAAGCRVSVSAGTLSDQLLPHREQHATVSSYTTTVTQWAQCVRDRSDQKIPKLEQKHLIEKKTCLIAKICLRLPPPRHIQLE